jgi:pimeloyl-ACP methyl ester carboxylesterase
MQRPVMNPSILLDLEQPQAPKRRFRRALAAFVRGFWAVLTFEPFGFLKPRRRFHLEEVPPFQKFCRAILYRVAGIPAVLIAIAAVMVFNGTHPPIVAPTTDPRSLGVYHDPISFLSDDGTRLEAWLVPAVDAKRVVAEKESALRKKSPAVVLVHDYGATREQMLPLVRPLHDAGFVVLVLSLRGSDSRLPAGQTFGLTESDDVKAAVDVLRKRPSVNPEKIAIIGEGTGATAALLCASRDTGVAAVVLDNPLTHTDQVMSRIAPGQWWLAWMRPMCKWTFDFAYNVDADDVSLKHLQPVLSAKPSLMLDNRDAGVAGMRRYAMVQVVEFLKTHLQAPAGGAPSRVTTIADEPAAGQ